MKRWLAILLCLLLSGAGAVAETYVVSGPVGEAASGDAMLVRDDGTVLTPRDTYWDITLLTPAGTPEAERLYRARRSAAERTPILPLWEDDAEEEPLAALMSAAGDPLTGFDYAELEYAGPDEIVYTLPGRWQGVMDASGDIRLFADYADIQPAGNGGYLAFDAGDGPVDYGLKYPLLFVDAEGQTHDTGLHAGTDSLGAYVNGICAVSWIEEFGDGAAYFDDHGNLLFDAHFEEADDFKGHYAHVVVNGRHGLIDREGQYRLEPEYDDISSDTSINGPIFIATRGGRLSVFNADSGEALFEVEFDAEDVDAWMENEAMLRVYADDSVYLYGLDGECLMEMSRDSQIQCWFSHPCKGVPTRVIEVQEADLYSVSRLLDMEGKPVSGDFQGLMGAIWQDGRGLYITECYRMYRDRQGDYGINWRTRRYGLCDQDGQTVLDAVYDNVTVLSMDRFWVTQGDRAGLIDAAGHWYCAISAYEQLMD